MAVSPLVPHSPAAGTSSPAKLRAANARSEATKPKNTSSPQPSQNTDRELTEQLNDEVRQKYVKGMCSQESRLSVLFLILISPDMIKQG